VIAPETAHHYGTIGVEFAFKRVLIVIKQYLHLSLEMFFAEWPMDNSVCLQPAGG